MLVCNTRSLCGRITGVQRYASELLVRFSNRVHPIRPVRYLPGVHGHMWEQFVLPMRIGKNLLWSPCNSGPLTVSHQVVTVHDVTPIDHPEWMSKRFSQWYGYMIPRLVKRVHRVITDSEYSRERILAVSGVAAEKVVAIPLAADARFRQETAARIQEVTARYGLVPGKYLLSVSSLEPRKNLSRLLKVWSRLLPEIPGDINLVLAGPAGPSAIFGDFELKDIPKRVEFTGYIPDDELPALYSGALGFVYLSLYEGFGLPPLEAMACGTPVLSSQATSLAEVVVGGALTVEPHDDEAISDGLKRLILDDALREKLKSEGLARAKQFSWDNTAERTMQVLQEAAQ